MPPPGLEDFLEEFSISRQTAVTLYASMEEAFQSLCAGMAARDILARRQPEGYRPW